MLRWTLTTVAVIAALTFVAASGVLNAVFWHSQARADVEGYILASVSVAGDVLKSVLPIFIAIAWSKRRWLYVGSASVAFVVFLVAGLVSAIGFVAANRGEVVGGRNAKAAHLDHARAELAAIDRQLSKLSGQRPVASLEAALAEMSQHARYLSSSSCTNATITSSREFCAEYLKTKAELGGAIEASRLSSKRSVLVEEIVSLERSGAGQEADPQAGIFARWLPGGLSVGAVRDGLVLFFAVLIELGAAFGLFLATRHGSHEMERSPLTNRDDVIPEGHYSIKASRLSSKEDVGAPHDNQLEKTVPHQVDDRITTGQNATSNVQALAPRRFVPQRRWIEGPEVEDNRLSSNGGGT